MYSLSAMKSRRNGTDVEFECRRNGSWRNGSRRNGKNHRRNGSRGNGSDSKKKSHKKRKHSSTSSSSRRRSSSSSSRERTKHQHKSKKKKHTSSRSSKLDKRVKKHKKKRSPPSSSSSSVSSYSSSSQQRGPARKKSRTRSRSPSSADESPHVPAPKVESPALSRDHLSLYADDDQFNSHSEDHQDLAPEAEIHSNVSNIHSNMSSEDMKFQNLIEEVFKLLPAVRFPRKTDDVLGGNKPRSSIEMELMKAPKKCISLPQSKCPLSKTIDCIKQSLGAVETDGSYPMPSTIAQDWLPSKADINKLVKLK